MLDGIPGTPFDGEVLIRRRRWASEETGFGVLDADWQDDEIVLVGTIAHLEERERARVSGVWKEDHRYGLQVNVALAEPLPPSGDAALTAYLVRVKHVGRVRAAKLLARYGDDVLDAIDGDPARAFRNVGLSPRRVNEAIRSWHGLRSTRALHLLLAPHGLAWLVPRLVKEYGDRAQQMVSRRPYDLVSVFGVGFAIADTIARAGGIPGDSPARTQAGAVHVLSEAERSGSTCLPLDVLAARAAELLGFAPPAAALTDDLVVDAG